MTPLTPCTRRALDPSYRLAIPFQRRMKLRLRSCTEGPSTRHCTSCQGIRGCLAGSTTLGGGSVLPSLRRLAYGCLRLEAPEVNKPRSEKVNASKAFLVSSSSLGGSPLMSMLFSHATTTVALSIALAVPLSFSRSNWFCRDLSRLP
ncbi:hypothetical protein D3C71_1788760 [compost metagenome]